MMWQRTSVRVVASFVFASSIGCVGTSSEDALEAADFGNALGESYCRFAVDCGTTRDYETCLSATNYEVGFARARASIDAGRLEFDGVAARACLDALDVECSASEIGALLLFARSLDFDALATVNRVRDTFEVPSCRRIFAGTVEEGGDCVDQFECVGDAYCLPSPGCDGSACCLRQCGPAAIRWTGNDCASDADCDYDEYCVESASLDGATECRTYRRVGEPCDEVEYRCRNGLTCRSFAWGGPFCMRGAQEGEPCGDEFHPGLDCDRMDNRCSHETWVCEKRLGSGEPCSWDSCLDYAECSEDESMHMVDAAVYRCVSRPTLGESCARPLPYGPLTCLDSTYCSEAGVCELDDWSLGCP